MSQADKIKCSNCRKLIEQMVVMDCKHHLCLPCASLNIENNGKSWEVACSKCSTMTSMEKDAAEWLLKKKNQTKLNCYVSKQPTQSTTLKMRPPSPSLLYCQQCQIAIGNLDSYLMSQHRSHQTIHIRTMQHLLPLINQCKQQLQQSHSVLSTRLQQDQTLLAFLKQRQQIQHKKLQQQFDRLRRILKQRETALQRQINTAFQALFHSIESNKVIQSQQIHKINIKLKQINESIRHKTVEEMFIQLSNKTIIKMQDDGEYKNKIKKMKDDMETKINKQHLFMKQIDRWIEQMPQEMKEQPMSSRASRLITVENSPKASFIKKSTILPQFMIQPNITRQTRNTRSTSSLGPSLLNFDKSTPMQGLLRTLERRIQQKSQKLATVLGSPRISLRPAERMKRLFSP